MLTTFSLSWQLIASVPYSIGIKFILLCWRSGSSLSFLALLVMLLRERERERENRAKVRRRRGWAENKTRGKKNESWGMIWGWRRLAAKCVLRSVFLWMRHASVCGSFGSPACFLHCGGWIPILTRGPHAVATVCSGFLFFYLFIFLLVLVSVCVSLSFSFSSPTSLQTQYLFNILGFFSTTILSSLACLFFFFFFAQQ